MSMTFFMLERVEHPVIHNCERTGYPLGEPKWPVCPKCGAETDLFYKRDGMITGCEVCTSPVDKEEMERLVCPKCGSETGPFYKQDGKITGCEVCTSPVDAWEEMERMAWIER